MRTLACCFLTVSFSFPGTCIIRVPDGRVCTTEFAYGVSSSVTDLNTGAAINNATLTLQDGTYQEVMQLIPTGDYVGAGERPGTYTLTATAPGYQPYTIDNIVVTADECHVRGVRVDVKLQAVE